MKSCFKQPIRSVLDIDGFSRFSRYWKRILKSGFRFRINRNFLNQIKIRVNSQQLAFKILFETDAFALSFLCFESTAMTLLYTTIYNRIFFFCSVECFYYRLHFSATHTKAANTLIYSLKNKHCRSRAF